MENGKKIKSKRNRNGKQISCVYACARCMFAPMLCIVATDSYKIDHHIGEQLIESQTQNPYKLHSQHTRPFAKLHSSFVQSTEIANTMVTRAHFFCDFCPSRSPSRLLQYVRLARVGC